MANEAPQVPIDICQACGVPEPFVRHFKNHKPECQVAAALARARTSEESHRALLADLTKMRDRYNDAFSPDNVFAWSVVDDLDKIINK